MHATQFNQDHISYCGHPCERSSVGVLKKTCSDIQKHCFEIRHTDHVILFSSAVFPFGFSVIAGHNLCGVLSWAL